MQRYQIIDNQTKTNIEAWLDRVIGQIRTELHNAGVNASGNLSSSLEGVVGDESVQILAAPYFLYAEKGRDAGKVPRNFVDIISRWIDDKGLVIPAKYKSQKQFASAIAYKIKRYGSLRYREPDKRVDLLGDVLDKELPELNKIIENKVVVYVNDNLFQ